MPVSYFSSTSEISFKPVAPRDQAVGPIEVTFRLTPPDETIAPPETRNTGTSRYYGTMVFIAMLTGAGALLLAA